MPHCRKTRFGRSLVVRERQEFSVRPSSEPALGRIRHWWQARPMAGLAAGWIAIALVGWRVWSVLNSHHPA